MERRLEGLAQTRLSSSVNVAAIKLLPTAYLKPGFVFPLVVVVFDIDDGHIL
jgi:hypothetical protein